MTTVENKPKHLGLSIVIGIAIGTLAAILSSHVAVWLIAGVFVGIEPERRSAENNVQTAKPESKRG